MKNFEKNKKQNNNKNRNGLQIWCKGTFPPNLALIYLTGFEKTSFYGRRTPRDDSSSAVQ